MRQRDPMETIDESATDDLLDAIQMTDLKCKINNLIWAYGPSSLTLGAADDIACRFLSDLRPNEYPLSKKTSP